MFPYPLSKDSPKNNHQNLKKFTINKIEINKPSIILDHHVPNDLLLISVVAAIAYIRPNVNYPFHQILFKITMLHQYLLDKIVRVHHQSIHPIIVHKNFEVFIDFILSTDHLRRYLFEKHFTRIRPKQIVFPGLSLFVLLLLLLLFPLTLATKLPSTTKFNHFPINNYTSFSFIVNTSLKTPVWHAACCIKSNRTMCDNSRSYSFSTSHSVYESNDTSSGTFLFDGGTQFIDRPRFSHTNDYLYVPDLLHNQTVFCLRYDVFRYLSTYPLAIFTYCVVVIGIIFNACVFLVLMFGSLRRSKSFTLFVALTCFDLLSLASSLFALLFRTVMTYLKSSALFCKMFGIFFLFFRQCSSTTLLLIAVERCIVIKYPFCQYMFEKFRLAFLGFIMLMYVVPIPFDFVFFTRGTLHCEAFDTPHAHRYQIFRGFFTVFTYAMIPFFGIAISNLLIIIELKKSKKRFVIKENDGTKRSLSTNTPEQRGTTVMLFVASFAFLLLLGPFYLHWCVSYLFYNYPQCHFTRNLYENVQVCMGVFHPYLTVIEKGMRELNHATNFLLYMATSSRFRSDFKRIGRRIFYRTCGWLILFLCKHIFVCCPQPSFLVSLEQNVSDTRDPESSLDAHRKNQAAYKTAHYYTNIERRRRQRQNPLLNTVLSDNTNTTTLVPELSPRASLDPSLQESVGKAARTLSWKPHSRRKRKIENRRQAARLSKHFVTRGVV